MAETIRRKSRPVRRQARAQAKGRKLRGARKGTSTIAGRILGAIPLSEAQLHRLFLVLILCVLLVPLWFAASMAGLTSLAADRFAHAAGDAGFEVRRVEIRGIERMNELKVYDRVLGERDRAMPLVDLHALRDELMTLSWVRDARVSRQLPDTIVVDIVEREPYAVFQRPDRLMLIDIDGTLLEPVARSQVGDMMVISGAGARSEIHALGDLLDSAPALRPQITAAEWVGNRRWNLTFRTGQILALPQGGDRSSTALMSFARLDGTNRLIGGKVARFDMRTPERIYMQVPGRAQAQAELLEGS